MYNVILEHVRGIHEIRIQESTHQLQITFLTLISFEENLFMKLFLKNKKMILFMLNIILVV